MCQQILKLGIVTPTVMATLSSILTQMGMIQKGLDIVMSLTILDVEMPM